MTYFKFFIALLIEWLSLLLPIPQSVREKYGIKHPHEEEFVGTWVSDDGGVMILEADNTLLFYHVSWDKIINIDIPRDGMGTWCFYQSDDRYYVEVRVPIETQGETIDDYSISFDILGTGPFYIGPPWIMVDYRGDADDMSSWFVYERKPEAKPQSAREQLGVKHPIEEEVLGTWKTKDGGIVIFNNDSTIAYHNIPWDKIIQGSALPMDGTGTWRLGKTDLHNNYYVDISIPKREDMAQCYYRTFVIIKDLKLFNKVVFPMQMVYCRSDQNAFSFECILEKSK